MPDQIPTDIATLQPESIKVLQRRPIDDLDPSVIDAMAAAAEKDIQAAGGGKALLETIVKIGRTVGRLFLPLMLLFCFALVLPGCLGTNRPPSIVSLSAGKAAILDQAISDKAVRDEAHLAALRAREQAKLAGAFERDRLKANNLEIDPVTKRPMVAYVDPEGKKYLEPLDEYIARIVALRDDYQAKIDKQIGIEAAEDRKILTKLNAVKRLEEIEQRYNQKMQDGSIKPEDVSALADEFAATLQPILLPSK